MATKMVLELRELTYKDRLKEMGLPTLQDRRERGDLITLFKIVNGIEKTEQAGSGVDEWRNWTGERTLKENQEESTFKGQ